MNTGISFQIGPEQEDRCRRGGEGQARPAGSENEGHPTCADLEKGVQGFLSPTEPVPTPTLLCEGSPHFFTGSQWGWGGPGVPHPEARGSTVRGLLEIYSPG